MSSKKNGSSAPQRSSTATASVNNRANQLNPNNGAYWSSRDLPRPGPCGDGFVQPVSSGDTGNNRGSNTNTGK